MFLYVFILIGLNAHAQFDPSTALLLRSPAAPTLAPGWPAVAEDLDPEIYHVVPKPAHARRPSPVKPAGAEPVAPTAEPAPTPVATVPRLVRVPAAAGVPEDRIAVRVSGGYLSFNSASPTASRAYTLAAPAAGLGLDFWMTPNFGLRGEYWSSIAAGTRDRVLNAGVSVDVEQIDLGVTYRTSRQIRELTTDFDFGLSYHETSADFAHSARGLIGHRTRGADLSFAVARPATAQYAHQAEAHLTALVIHDQLGLRMDEGPATTRQLTPGASAAIGGRYRFESGTHAFWRLEYLWEQNRFATVRVNTHLTMLRFGLEWGT